MTSPIVQHDTEIQLNLAAWKEKPLLQEVYRLLYDNITPWIDESLPGPVVEIGAGIGNFKLAYPAVITTDLFDNSWVDRKETAYKLSFADESISHLVLFDVFHHLAYPGSALKEFNRVLCPGGRVIMFEPHISLLGLMVYGLFHHEPIAWSDPIIWLTPPDIDPDMQYYAAQGNPTRVFSYRSPFFEDIRRDWNILTYKKIPALYYILSGGFSKPALYPRSWLLRVVGADRYFNFLPQLFATRMLVVLEKRNQLKRSDGVTNPAL